MPQNMDNQSMVNKQWIENGEIEKTHLWLKQEDLSEDGEMADALHFLPITNEARVESQMSSNKERALISNANK